MHQNARVDPPAGIDHLDGRENWHDGRTNGHNGWHDAAPTGNGSSGNGGSGSALSDEAESLWFRSSQHDAVAASIRRLIEANQEVRRTMQANERVLRRTLRSLEAGHGIAGTFARVPTVPARQASNDAERALLRARHQLRLAVFDAGLAEGMSIAELARCWGFSRQLGARYVKEIRTRRAEPVSSAAGANGVATAGA